MESRKMNEPSAIVADLSTCAEEIMYLLWAHGVEYLFLNPGTDSAPLQEAATALGSRDIPVPRVITCSFESVALAAAHGYWQRTGRPQAVFVHVDVGTQNLGAMVHNILRDHAGVIVLAGRTPYSENASVPGSRSSAIHWQQDVTDQAGILRGYAKWTYELTRSGETSRVVGRALQIAGGGKPGLAYLMLSRDVLMDPPGVEGQRRIDRFARPAPPAMEKKVLEHVANLLISAKRPVIIAGRLGRGVGGMRALSELASLGAIPVVGRVPGSNLPTSHPMCVRSERRANELITDADVLVLIECDVPWVPSKTKVSSEATIIQIDSDPVKADMPLWYFPVDIAVTADGGVALKELLDAVSVRVESLELEWPTRVVRQRNGAGIERPSDIRYVESPEDGLGVQDVIVALNRVLRADDVVVLEAVSNNALVLEMLERTEPDSVCSSGGPGLGWALGASVGVKLANPERRVVAIVGDGAFMFGVPTSAFCLAAEADAPFVVVVLNNNGYRASRIPVYELFPKGASAAAGSVVGTRFAHPPDFAAVAEACGAHGRRVTELGQLLDVLEEAFEIAGSGRTAVVDVHVGE